MTAINPYPPDTQKHRIFEALRDMKWHCSEHELPGSQPAKALQMMRQDGFQFEKVNHNWEKRIHCLNCARITPHRRLITLERLQQDVSRITFSLLIRKRIIEHYDGKDEILGYAPTGRAIEIDHRTPQIRWKSAEEELSMRPSDEEIEKRYMLLVREHNLLKSRNCEKCVKTGKRQPLLGISFFYEGTQEYDPAIGCQGCGWHNPKEWKKRLNEKINNQ